MILSTECPRCCGEGHLYRQDCGAHGLTVACPRCLGTGEDAYKAARAWATRRGKYGERGHR